MLAGERDVAESHRSGIGEHAVLITIHQPLEHRFRLVELAELEEDIAGHGEQRGTQHRGVLGIDGGDALQVQVRPIRPADELG